MRAGGANRVAPSNSASRRSPTTSRRSPTRASSPASSMSSWQRSNRWPRDYSPPKTGRCGSDAPVRGIGNGLSPAPLGSRSERADSQTSAPFPARPYPGGAPDRLPSMDEHSEDQDFPEIELRLLEFGSAPLPAGVAGRALARVRGAGGRKLSGA